jgi:peptidyl-prolyl cis-trans isomerase C
LREPVVWFVLIAAILFGADHYLNNQDDQIVVDAAVRQRLDTLWETQTGNAAKPREIDSLVQSWLKEEIMFREAMQLGLERDDTIVRRRLIQKLSFLSEEVGANTNAETSQDVLTRYYNAHQDQYTTETRYSFFQIFFSSMQKAEQHRGTFSTMPEQWQSLGESSLLNQTYKEVSFAEARRDFGSEFARSLQTLNVEDEGWKGPIKSSYGYHFVLIEDVKPEKQLPFAMVSARVALDYADQQKSNSQADYYNALLEKYEVVYE